MQQLDAQTGLPAGRRFTNLSGDIGMLGTSIDDDDNGGNFYDHHYICSSTIPASQSRNNFTVDNPAFLKAKQLRIDEIVIPYSWFNVNSNNNTLSGSYNGTNFTITLTSGNYTASQLSTALSSAFTQAPLSFPANSWSTDTVTATFYTITTPAGTTNLTINANVGIANMIGIGPNNLVITSQTTTTLPQMINLSPIRHILLCSRALSIFDTRIRVNFPTFNVIAMIPVAGTGNVQAPGFGSSFSYKPKTPLQFSIKFSQPLDFQFVDMTGTPIPFNNNGGEIMMHFTYYRSGKTVLEH